jgi:hypothetical protein
VAVRARWIGYLASPGARPNRLRKQRLKYDTSLKPPINAISLIRKLLQRGSDNIWNVF